MENGKINSSFVWRVLAGVVKQVDYDLFDAIAKNLAVRGLMTLVQDISITDRLSTVGVHGRLLCCHYEIKSVKVA